MIESVYPSFGSNLRKILNNNDLDETDCIPYDIMTGRTTSVVKAFKEGFNRVFPIEVMREYTATEFALYFLHQGGDGDWSIETLRQYVQPYDTNTNNEEVEKVIQIMAEYDTDNRKRFL
ncbi:3537_t:CDS:2, partial [Racocetra fulgida]